MGFGDVTLMAMIGAAIGWQASVMLFFIAPLMALVVGIISWLARRENEIPYGPFLCLAAALIVLRWESIWPAAAERFEMGLVVPMILAFGLVMLAILLALIQLVKRFFRVNED